MKKLVIISRVSLCLLVVLGSILLAPSSTAQVFDLGPSDSALFDNVINLAPDVDPFLLDVGGDGLTTQVNILDGGSLSGSFFAESGSEVNITGGNLGFGFDANSGSEVNISGGEVGLIFDANSGSVVNISGGEIGTDFNANSGSQVNITGGNIGIFFEALSGSVVRISGGSVGRRFDAQPGSDVELIGGDFELNGTAFLEPTISLGANDVFTGTLSDGSTFIFSERSTILSARDPNDNLSNVTLTSGALPPLDLSPMVVATANPIRPSGLRAGQTLTLQNGGELGGNFEVVGATLNVEGGELGPSAAALRSEVNISGGSVGTDFIAHSGSEVNISGGSIGGRIDVLSGSSVSISGGTVGGNFNARSGSAVSISAGAVGSGFNAESGSDVELIGGNFELNGTAFSGSIISLAADDIFTGTLTDGSAFVFAGVTDVLSDVRLTSGVVPPIDLSPVVVATANPIRPSGLFAGQTLTLLDGGELGDSFEAIDATVDIQGGELGDGAAAVRSTVDISGGTVGGFFNALSGSEVNISGGSVGGLSAFAGSVVNLSGGSMGNSSRARSGSVVNISGGSLGEFFNASFGSVVNISGGNIGDNFQANTGSVVNISGGIFGDPLVSPFTRGIQAIGGSEVNLFGSNFVLGGVPLDDSLVTGEALTIDDRDVLLSGLLADGSPFSFILASDFSIFSDSFAPSATLTVTLGAPVPAVILADANQDGTVDISDIQAFISVLQSGEFQAEADCDENGVVDFSDIAAFIQILSGA